MDDMNMIERLTRAEESTKSAHKRLDKMEEIQAEIHNLALSVSKLAGAVENVCNGSNALENRVKSIEDRPDGLCAEDYKNLDARIKCIEEKPARRWEQLTGIILGLAASGIIGFLISHLLDGK